MVFILGFFITKYLYKFWDDLIENGAHFAYLFFTIIELFIEVGAILDFLTK